MTLHIFNPSHDMAMAAGIANYTPPHAARDMWAALAFLPALWADDDGYVLVGDTAHAKRSLSRVRARLLSIGVELNSRVHFAEPSMLGVLAFSRVEPWGWDAALCQFLQRHGMDGRTLPGASDLQHIRDLSHRANVFRLLSKIKGDGFVGRACQCLTVDHVERLLRRNGHIVVKAPWSGSGRGVRFIRHSIDEQTLGWIRNTISRQGSVMVEPYYNKVRDLGMEFLTDRNGVTRYLGLSLFSTNRGAYTGNILATEDEKRQLVSRYIPLDTIDSVSDAICRIGAGDDYHGPFGVDMMIVAGNDSNGFLLHPCVELNLRLTMGSAALKISPQQPGNMRLMSIVTGIRPRLAISRLILPPSL